MAQDLVVTARREAMILGSRTGDVQLYFLPLESQDTLLFRKSYGREDVKDRPEREVLAEILDEFKKSVLEQFDAYRLKEQEDLQQLIRESKQA